MAKPFSGNDFRQMSSSLRTTFSQDIIEFYSNFGGFENEDLDDECMTFWVKEKILQENKSNAELIHFADYLIYSHLYAFKFENTDRSAIYAVFAENNVIKVADSLAEFFDFYVNDIRRIFP